VEFKDYYKTLGVPRTATADEIRKAFRSLARRYHPDVAKEKKQAEEKFKEINEAYEVLGDPEKRAKYDALGEDWKTPSHRSSRGSRSPGTPGEAGAEAFEFEFNGTGFSDFFEQFFSGRHARAGRPPFGGSSMEDPRPDGTQGTDGGAGGGDIQGDLLVSLVDALRGAVHTLTLRHHNPLTGSEENETLRVRIPAGVREGQRIRIPGKGEKDPRRGVTGDLYLRVRLEKHPDFEVLGSDLVYELELAPWEAVLGAEVRIPTLEGSLGLKVPPGALAGQRLRVRGQGLSTDARGSGRGDLYAVIQVRVPPRVTGEEKRAWEELAKQSRWTPRAPLP